MWSLILSILERYWKVVLIAILGAVCFILWNRVQIVKHEAKMANYTITELQRKDDYKTKQLKLNKEQFKEEIKKYQWALDSAKVKEKLVEKVHYIKTVKHIHDTTEITQVIHDTVTYNKAYFNDCGMTVTTMWIEGDSTATFDIRDTSEMAIVCYKTVPFGNFGKHKHTT